MKNICALVQEFIREYDKFSQVDKEISDEFVSAYLDVVTTLFKHDSLAGAGFKYHEKWEIREYLRMDFSEEELRRRGPGLEILDHEDSERPKNAYDIAHGRALYEEHLFYQRIGERILGKVIPIPALKLVRDSLTMQGILSNVFYDFGEYNDLVKSQTFAKEDVSGAIELFEKTGWQFKDKDGIFEYFNFLISKPKPLSTD